MARFSVPDMTCDGCARAITSALRAADEAAIVRVDLAALIVDVASQKPDQVLADAIADAGFTVKLAA